MKARPIAVVAALLLILAGCGVGQAPPGPAPTVHSGTSTGGAEPGFNGTDVMFLQMMVPHHGQGLELVRLAQNRPVRADLRILAAAIEVTQAAEIQTMSGWLRRWAQPPSADPAAHAAHGGMPGTSPAELAVLAAAPDDAFEHLLLNTLIAHQDDAVQIARMETAGGVNPAARELAGQIDRSRTAQIQQLLRYSDATAL
jgi:uncharacterized protein (DUF305 family)